MDKILYYSDTKEDLDGVINMFGAFHDARFYDIQYIPAEDKLDVIIQYDDYEPKRVLNDIQILKVRL